MKSFVEVGTIVKPHGFRGELLAVSHSGKSSALGYVKEIFTGFSPNELVPRKILIADWMPKGWKLKLEGIDSDQAIAPLRGQKLFALRNSLQPLEPGEYYIVDLIGASVLESDSERIIGKLVGVESASKQAFQERWVVETPDGQLSIPASKHFIENVDIAARIIRVKNLSELK